MNILTNAVTYTEKGNVILRIGYEKLPAEPDCVNLKVLVKDTGIGIKPEDIEKLFTEFERIEVKRTRNVEGRFETDKRQNLKTGLVWTGK